MNIKITYSWLLDYLDTDANPYEIQKYLSLSGPSVETVEKIGDEYVFDIEITSNRVDMASVFGIAQEAQAILPQFGKKAKLKINPLEKYSFKKSGLLEKGGDDNLDVEIKGENLCSRFTAIVMNSVDVKESPAKIAKRLELCDIRPLNNVIDISNYLMLSLGQPTHIFDYDKIAGKKMILRESKKGEKIITLDGKKINLPGQDIVIEDGSSNIIDLCGIMGGNNSKVDENTKSILFFVQTYNKKNIRRTSMLTGQRSVAATYFEKGLDTERVEPTLCFGVELLKKETGGQISSKLIDIYPKRPKEKQVRAYLKDIQRVMGVSIEEKKITSILKNLGFKVERFENDELAYPDSVFFDVTVPTFRADDVDIKEDIIEEVARIYGYYKLPSIMSPLVHIKQPKDIEGLFKITQRIKHFLKTLGLHEFMNYSMISGQMIDDLDMKKGGHLKLANTISKEIEYMRISLLPSLIKNNIENKGKKDELKIFEIAKVYKKRENDLPTEKYKLAISADTDFFDLKGILTAIFEELNIKNISYKNGDYNLFSKNKSAVIYSGKEIIGFIGALNEKYIEKFSLKKDLYLAEIDFEFLIKNYSDIASYEEPIKTAIVKLDSTIDMSAINYSDLKRQAFSISKHLINIEIIDSYKNNLTIRFYFADKDKNIEEDAAKKELDSILEKVEK